jgi:ActR/RegA family two-component response regulator
VSGLPPPSAGAPPSRSVGQRATVLAIVEDPTTRALLPRVIHRDQLLLTADMAEGLSLAMEHTPDAAFVEIGIGGGAGLAMVHHLKAVVPNVTIIALASRGALEAAANAVALGGAGLLMLPVGGDEIISAVSAIKARAAERALRLDLEQASAMYARAAGWMARVAELADCPSRAAAAQLLIEVIAEATSASAGAVYLSVADKATELLRTAALPPLDRAPPFGMEADILEYARAERLLVIPLSTRTFKTGYVLVAEQRERSIARDLAPRSRPAAFNPRPFIHRIDGLVKLLATQATAAFALLAERDRSSGAPVKDPSSSAYSFAYYVDVAGREIDKARRYGRRFAIATIALEPPPGEEPALAPAEMADQLLKAARDTDVLARVDEHEFHLLMPETDGLGAHACRRRLLARMAERIADQIGQIVPRGLLIGVATFPHDGIDLSQLLRVARRRAEATKASVVHRIAADNLDLRGLLDTLDWAAYSGSAAELATPRHVALPIADATALASTVVADALRGGAALFTVTHHASLSLGAAVRASLGAPRENVILHALDVRASHGDDIEALSVIAEHGAYAFIGRIEGGVIRGMHASDPLFADLVAERLGRAAGLRIFA